MKLGERRVYVFVRQDLSLANQLTQACHAAFQIGLGVEWEGGIPSLITIGVPDEPALIRVRQKLDEVGIDYYDYQEPEEINDLGFTALAVYPLPKEQWGVLKNYRLWNPVNNQV